jgi:dihydrofolate reductase
MFGSDPEAITGVVETLWNASLHIMGSRAFEMAAYWPTSTAVFAPPMNQIPKAVFSKQGPAILKLATAAAAHGAGQPAEMQPGGESWAQAYVASGDLAEEVAKLKAQEGKPIIAHGGASFVRSLVAQGLIDQYNLMVHPVVLGQGLPIFSDLTAPRGLKLVSSKAFAGGSVAQVYRPA